MARRSGPRNSGQQNRKRRPQNNRNGRNNQFNRKRSSQSGQGKSRRPRPRYGRESQPVEEKKANWWTRYVLSYFSKKPKEPRRPVGVDIFDKFSASDLRGDPTEALENIPAIFSVYPELVGNIDWHDLRKSEETSPPVRLMKSQHLFGSNHVYTKRESLDVDWLVEHEARKFEFSLSELVNSKASKIIGFAYFGSPYSLALAQLCKMLGLNLEIHFLRDRLSDLRIKRFLQIKELGAKTKFHSSQDSIQKQIKSSERMSKFFNWKVLSFEGRHPFAPMGYISATLELMQQVENGEVPRPTKVFVPVEGGAAFVGMCLGKIVAGWKDLKIIGVDIRGETNSSLLASQAQSVIENLNQFLSRKIDYQFSAQDFPIIGPSHEAAQDESDLVRWTNRIFDLENLEMDPQTTAVAFLAMRDFIEKEKLENEVLLFWNTFSTVKSNYLHFNLRKVELPRRLQSWKNEDRKKGEAALS